MRIRLSNERPTLHLRLWAKANIKPTQTGERTKQGQAAACVSQRARARDGQILDWDAAKCVSVLASRQRNSTETLRSTGVESGLVFPRVINISPEFLRERLISGRIFCSKHCRFGRSWVNRTAVFYCKSPCGTKMGRDKERAPENSLDRTSKWKMWLKSELSFSWQLCSPLASLLLLITKLHILV